MKRIILTGLLLLAAGTRLLAYEINWVTKSEELIPEARQRLVFNVVKTGNDADLTAGQVMQMVVVDQSLDTFMHYFPVRGADGNFSQDIVFPNEGRYLFFFNFQPQPGVPVMLRSTLDVGDVADRFATVSLYFDTEQVTDDMMKVAFSVVPKDIKEKTATQITFAFIQGQSGEPVQDLQEYLQGAGELVVINSTGKIYDQAASAERMPAVVDPKKAKKVFFGPRVNFTMTFPEKGIYKLWGEFRHKNQMILVPFMVWVK
jgi:hypothetical protein